jgi:hypothetical protein
LAVPEVSDVSKKRVIVVVPHQQKIQGGGCDPGSLEAVGV